MQEDEALLLLDSQIYVRDSNAHLLTKPYKDGHSVGAKHFEEAFGKTKV